MRSERKLRGCSKNRKWHVTSASGPLDYGRKADTWAIHGPSRVSKGRDDIII